MKFFMPDWDDRIDPGFNFETDESTPNRNIIINDVYAHEDKALGEFPYDGLLVSRGVVEKSKARNELINRDGIHACFRVPKNFPVMGDCGAFSYVESKFPLYETGDVLDYYTRIGVDFGVSVDHLVFSKMPIEERRRRKTLTLQNAYYFLEGHRAKNCRFLPVGAAQGWNPESYSDSVWRLLQLGYRYIALGGLARSSAKDILKILHEVNKAIRDFKVLQNLDHVDLHLLGVAKLSYVKEFIDLGVTSMDSASHLRKAWLRSGQNYWTLSGTWYTAIRVPQSSNPRVKEYISQNGRVLSEVIEKEQHIIRMLHDYDTGLLTAKHLGMILDEVLDYDDYLLRAGDDGQEMRNKTLSREKYQKVLADRPWEKCPCKVCQSAGIDVVIFRGTNRNKRRGFHNVWVFYQHLQEILAIQS